MLFKVMLTTPETMSERSRMKYPCSNHNKLVVKNKRIVYKDKS